MPIRGALRHATGAGNFAPTPPPASPPTILSFTLDDTTLETTQLGTFAATFGGGTLTQWTLDVNDGAPVEYTGSASPMSQGHTYTSAGTYTARLVATGPGGSAQATITNIVVTAPAPPPPPPPPSTPDVVVRGNSTVIADGDSTPSFPDHTQFVTAVQSAGGTTRVFTVENPGTAALTTSGLTVPTGFTVTEGLSATIAAGASDTFTVRLDDATLGVKSGDISFATNVTGKNPYNFAISGEVVAASGDGVARWSMTTDFGTQRQSAGNVDRTLRIYNASDTTSLTTSSLAVPSGMSVVGSLPSSISPLAWADVTVRMLDATAGSKSGNITLNTSDPATPTLTIPVVGTVAATGTEILLRTETRRNLTGTTQNKPPIRFPLVFERGEVPTTETLVLRRGDDTLVATTHWQWGERSTYPDGSLRACVIRCYGPASWTTNTDYTLKVLKAAGSWPAETNTRSTTDVTANSNRQIRFLDLRRVYDSGAPASDVFLTQPAIGSGTFYNSLNDDIVNAAAFKRTAGPICTQWSCWSQSRDLSGGAADDDLKVEHYVEAWTDPDAGNVVKWICWEPSISNGQWHDSGLRSRSVLYELEVFEAGSSIRNWRRTLARTSGDVTTASSRIRTGTSAFPSFSWGGVLKFTGTPPAPCTTGKYYPFTWNDTLGTGQAINICNINNPVYPGPWNAGAGQTLVSFTNTGSGFSLNCAVMHPMGRAYPLREDDGFEHWIMVDGVASTGAGPKIVPNWSEAQILERQRAGQLYPIPIRAMDGTLAPQANSVRNTEFTADFAPWTIMWMPCTSVLGMKNGFDGGGLDYYTGDSTRFMVDLLRGMTSLPHHVQFRMGANDWPRFQNIRNYDKTTNGATGMPFNRVRPSNLGPDRAGASYSGLNTPLPTIRGGDLNGTNSWIANRTAAYGGLDTYQDGHLSASNEGHHTSPANIENWALYASPLDWRYAAASGVAGIQSLPPGLNSVSGRDRLHGGVTFSGVLMLGDGEWGISTSRANGQIMRFITAAMTGPDVEPEVAYFKDIVRDNCDYIELAMTTPAILGPVHKAMGIVNAIVAEGGGGAGGNQGWWHARCKVNYLFTYKRAGRSNHDVLDFYTNSIMGVAGRKRTGPGQVIQAKPHLSSGNLAWNYLRCSSANGNFAGSMDDSRHIVTDGWSAMVFDTGLRSLWFQTDSRIRIEEGIVDQNNAPPESANGDSFCIRNHSASTPPSPVAINTYYWLYDRQVQTRLIQTIVVTGLLSSGETITQGGNTATASTVTYLSGGGPTYTYRVEFTPPTPGPFVNGAISFSGGGTATYNEANVQDFKVTYRICTDYANQAATRVTWSIGTEDLEQRVSLRLAGLGRNAGWAIGNLADVDYEMQQFNPAACAHTWFRRTDVAPIFTTYRNMIQEVRPSVWTNFEGSRYRQNYYQALG